MSPENRPRIHPTALVEPGVEIGARTAVWDGVHMRGPTTIGRDCIIGEKTYVAYGVTVGDGVKVNAHVYVCTGVTIEDRVMIAAGVIFTNDRYPRAFDDDGGLAFSGPTADTLSTVVRTGATIGAGALVGPGLEIGAYAMVGMGTVVTRNVPPHALVVGTPARLAGWVCVCGRPLPGGTASREDMEWCPGCGRRYALAGGPDGLAACREVA
jgi:UDP-2-acetamido-3-amino-2,3-dideoxy-glucuronate N-acetyltransferase